MARKNDLAAFEAQIENLNNLNRKELEKLNRAVAKRSNVRLKAQEDYTTRESKALGVKVNVTKMGAYKRAARHIGERSGGKVRFPEGHKGKSNKELRANIKAAMEYLRNPLSTISGTEELLMKHYRNFLNRIPAGARKNTPSPADFWHERERAWASNLKKIFDSDVVMEAYVQGKLDVLEEIASELIAKVEEETGQSAFRDIKTARGLPDYEAVDALKTKAAKAESDDARLHKFTTRRRR